MNYQFLNQVIPADEPVSLAEAKEWLKREVDDTSENSLIQLLISAARSYVEKYTGLLLSERQIVYKYRGSVIRFELPFGPYQKVTEITQTIDGVSTVLAEGGDYSVDEQGYYVMGIPLMWRLSVGRIHPLYTVTYTAGYSAANPIDPDLKLAMLLIIGETYTRRTHSVQGTIIAEVPIGAKELMKRFVRNIWAIA